MKRQSVHVGDLSPQVINLKGGESLLFLSLL